jgi:hypothetical protein
MRSRTRQGPEPGSEEITVPRQRRHHQKVLSRDDGLGQAAQIGHASFDERKLLPLTPDRAMTSCSYGSRGASPMLRVA